MPSRKVTARGASVAAALLMLLPACGQKAPETVVVALEDDIVSLDPHALDDEVTGSALANVYQALVGFDPQMRITPLLAQAWENPNDLIWRFRLRPGVRFHDGRLLNASDVVFSLERARSGRLSYYLSQVSTVRALDEMTVELVTRQPAPVLLNKLNFIAILPGGTPDSIAAPVGTGPYRFEEYQPGVRLVLRAFDGYWGGRSRIPRAEFAVLATPEERLEALARGEIQLAKFVQLRDSARHPEAGLVYHSLPGLGVTLLGANVRLPGPLRDRRVRQAVYWALDPAEIIARTGLDARPIGQLVSPFVVGFIPQAEADRPKADRARALLAQAGYGRGLSLELEASSSAAARAEAAASQLRSAGIDARVAPREWSALTERLNRRQAPFFLVGWSCVSGDASDLLEACLHSEGRAGYGSANWCGYSAPELDRQIEQAGRTLDARRRIVLLQQALSAGLEDMPLIPLYVRNQTYAHCRRLDFRPRQDGWVLISELSFRR